MTQSTFVSSQLIDAGSICPTAPHIALPLHSLYPAFGIDNVRLPLHIDQLRSAFSTAAFTREESRRAAAVHVHPPVLGYCSAHTHASYRATLTTPSPAGYYVNKPSISTLPPLLCPPPSLSSSRCRPACFTLDPHNNEEQPGDWLSVASSRTL